MKKISIYEISTMVVKKLPRDPSSFNFSQCVPFRSLNYIPIHSIKIFK